MNKNYHRMESMSIEDLEEMIRNYRINEQHLHELKRHTRHERKRAEYLLRENYRIKYEQNSILKKQSIQPSIEYFISFADDNNEQQSKISRVRFNLSQSNKSTINQDEELADLSRRCDELLVRLHPDLSSSLNNSVNHRSDCLSHSQQRIKSNVYNQSFHYQDMKRLTKKKYEQLPEVNERLQRELNNEIKRRNSLRAKIFRLRLQQHVLQHGRTNIDESLTILDT